MEQKTILDGLIKQLDLMVDIAGEMKDGDISRQLSAIKLFLNDNRDKVGIETFTRDKIGELLKANPKFANEWKKSAAIVGKPTPIKPEPVDMKLRQIMKTDSYAEIQKKLKVKLDAMGLHKVHELRKRVDNMNLYAEKPSDANEAVIAAVEVAERNHIARGDVVPDRDLLSFKIRAGIARD